MRRDPRRFRLFARYFGRDWMSDLPINWRVAFCVRGDLLRWPADEGMMIPVGLEVGFRGGQSPEAKMDGRLDGWVFRPWIRSDASEIARRLAGGDE